MINKIRNVYFFEFLLFVFIIIFGSAILNNYVENLMYIAEIFMIGFSGLVYLLYGFPRDKNYLKSTTVKIIIVILLIYFLIIYLLGFFVGFSYSLFDKNILMVIKNIVPYILLYSLIELSRYMLLKQSKNKSQIVILTVEFIILNIIIGINGLNLTGYERIFIVVSTLILPIIANGLLNSYITYKISFVPSLVYTIIIELYVYVVPFVPNLGNYLNSVFGLLLPFIVYFEVRRQLHYGEKYSSMSKKTFLNAMTTILIVFLLGIVSITRGVFKYQIIAIVSGSMEPIYYRGDAVIIEKCDSSKIQEGDILAFDMGNGIITHRVVKIRSVNGNYIFTTKGDNNKLEDIYEIRNNNVIGKVRYILKYAGYPTVVVHDLFEKR